MSHQDNGHANPQDLDVLALRYVMDELTTAETEAFEARLAEDQDARESVSRMVLLGTAIVREQDLAPVGSGSTAPAAGFGGWRLAIAAVVIVAIGFAVYFNRGTPTVHTESPLEQDAQGLLAWVEFGDIPDVAQAEAGFDATLDPFEHIEGGEVTLDIGAEAPSWMLEALAK